MKNLKSTALASFALVIALSMTPSQAHAAWSNGVWSWNWSSWWSNFRPHRPQNKPYHKPYLVVVNKKPHKNAPEPIIGLLAAGAVGVGGVMMRRRNKKKKGQA